MEVGELANLCREKKLRAVAVFGSYTRPKDYVEGVSDINVFVLGRDKRVLLELASEGFSPLMLDEASLKDLCEKGDPICFYVLKDSRVLCGELPNFEFRMNEGTCGKVREQALSFYSSSVESHFRTDEVNSLKYALKALKSSIMYAVCERERELFVSYDDLRRRCKALNLKGCEELSELNLMLRAKLHLTTWALDRIAEAISANVGVKVPKPSELMAKFGDWVAKLSHEGGKWRVMTKDGHWEDFV